MKSALCISGMPRTYKKIRNNFSERLINNNQLDIFLSTYLWDKDEDNMWPDQSSPYDIINDLKPKKYEIELFNNEYKDNFKNKLFETNKFHAVDRVLSMYYKIFKCNILKSTEESHQDFIYDIVIRCRPDIYFHENFILPSDIKDKTIYFPRSNQNFGICDLFWYSNSKVANKISSLYLNMKQIWDVCPMGIHAEMLLSLYVRMLGLNIQYFDLRFDTCRHSNGEYILGSHQDNLLSKYEN
jgi:hypothetical protein